MRSPRPAAPARVSLQSIGCKLNTYEIEALGDGFGAAGYQLVAAGAAADICVVNTCTVTGTGDADSRKAVRRLRRRNPAATVVATGCYAQRCPDELHAAGADLVVGNVDKARLLEHVQAFRRSGTTPPAIQAPAPRTREFLQISRRIEGGRTRGTLQVQDGCDEHCTYCVIPSVRGRSVSRAPAQVLQQAELMVAAGYRELVLTGVNTGSYGLDRGQAGALVALLRALDAVPGLQRLRLNSIEPNLLTDELIDTMAGLATGCRHFHIPLQSGADAVLRRMGRRYRSADYADRIERIARTVPECAIGADVMVGFPGEDAAAFAATERLIQGLPLTYLHVFPYSARAGTAAARLPDQQQAEVKKERARRLIALGQDKRLAFHRRQIGRQLDVLIEDRGAAADEPGVGMTDNYIKVRVSVPPAAAGRVLAVQVEAAQVDAVTGSLAA